MTDRQQQATRLAHGALTRSLVPGPDDFDHPVHETLEALVDGVLPAADREAVESHVAACATCAEDVADLEDIRARLMPARSASSSRRRLVQMGAIAAGLAAAIVLAVWVGQRPTERPTVAALPPAQPAPGIEPPLGLSPNEEQLVAQVLAAGALEIPAATRALAGKSGTLLGPEERAAQFGPEAPLATAITSTRPRFAWRAHPDATAYTVAVFDDRFSEVARGTRLGRTTWIPETDLPRGRSYAWQVTAHLPAGDVTAPAPPQPEARFHVTDDRTAMAAHELRMRLGDQPLALGILLAKAGLVQEAAQELERAGPQGRALVRAPR